MDQLAPNRMFNNRRGIPGQSSGNIAADTILSKILELSSASTVLSHSPAKQVSLNSATVNDRTNGAAALNLPAQRAIDAAELSDTVANDLAAQLAKSTESTELNLLA